MNKKDILVDIDELSQAKKRSAIGIKLIAILCIAIVILTMVFAFACVNSAMDKVIVIDRSGEYVKTKVEDNSKLFVSLISNQCALTAYYANSFDKLSINENQAWAAFLAPSDDLRRIYAKYNQERAYGDVIDRGIIYKCEFKEMKALEGTSEPYHVCFTSILSIIDGINIKKILITSQGTIIRHTPKYPENVTGFYFSSYTQNYELVQQEEEKNESN